MAITVVSFGFGLFLSLHFITIGICAGIAFALLGYFLPSVLAAHFQHPHMPQIVALNLVLGWTLFGWIAATVWASWGNRAAAPSPGVTENGTPF
ncbi:MAG TPA: superinfection immunity protein [Dongiaceae bacterium]|nr:superinfection immunity protein [Dongiaceae bacterium]